ncbi:MAG: helix-turn-helix domain-containing protein [Rhizomicrobium sp.]
MNNAIEGGPPSDIEQRLGFRPCAPTGLIARLGNKWTVLVISHLAVAPDHRARFSTLKNNIEGITQRMLTLTLRNLERDGLLLRHYFAEVPPRVEYELTDMGASMLPMLEWFTSWIRDNRTRIEACRRAFDDAHA